VIQLSNETHAIESAVAVFMPSGQRGQVALGSTVLDAARQFGVDLDSVCGGRGICGHCEITPIEGHFPEHGITSSLDHLTPDESVEAAYRKRKNLADDHRLGCRTTICGDIVVEVPPTSQVHRQVIRKQLDVTDFEINPVVRLCYVEVDPPVIDVPTGDRERLEAALEDQWGLGSIRIPSQLLPDIQASLRSGNWSVTVAIRDEHEMAAIWPGLHDVALGVAFDVGSTTIAGHLCNLASGEVLASAGTMNPQIRFGEDVMSRVSYVMMHPNSAHRLTEVVRSALDDLTGLLVTTAGADRTDILEITLVGNPIMHHILLGIDPRPLGEAPFALATDTAVTVTAAELNLTTSRAGRAYVLPCIAGHVGADTAAVLLSEAPHKSEALTLIVDIGTNAEIVLGNSKRLLAASSPTGPAFEGAQISSGQRAAPGAIERVRVDKTTLEPTFKVIGSDTWSNDRQFDGSMVTGICGSGIIEAVAELFLAGVILADGSIDGSTVDRSPRILADGRTFSYLLWAGKPQLLITQGDVRAIQLAKAALYAGVRLLMDHFGVAEVDTIRLAGAFGSQVDGKHAMVLGLIPDCDLDRVVPAGNAAGVGAMMALLDGAARTEVEAIVKRVEKVETAVEPRFQEHFVAAMGLPNTVAPFERLRSQVELPPAHMSAVKDADRRDRRCG